MRVAFLTTDNREQQTKYDLDQPFFGTAPAAILEGLQQFPDELEVHVISCAKRKMNVPEKLAANVWFHQPIVPYLGWGRTAFAGCALAVRKLLHELKPDLVHGQGTERDCAISAVYSGFPNVLTIHGNMQRIFRMKLLGANSYYWLASTLETHALKRTNGVFCNSIHTRALVEKRTRTTWLVPNPIRPAFLKAPASESQPNPLPIFLVVGVVTRLKRPLEILEVMQSLFNAGHRFKIRFVGSHSPDSPYGDRFQALLDEAISHGYAEYVGVLNENELILTMDAADALIHFPEEEAFGLVVAEALARGLKLFAAKVGGIPDIAKGVDGAELHEDFLSLGNGIAEWLKSGASSPSHTAEMMSSRYHPKVIGARHMEIYREVMNR
jgi:glycosyltransferase involved in cell wall biosynthesis